MAVLADAFQKNVEAGGLLTAMRWLNNRVPYRFSAIFAFHGDMLRNICLVDKQDSAITVCSDQAVSDSYCIYIQRSGERFSVEDALRDVRVEGHPKRNNFQCYYGVPLVGADGKLLGTVCHFGIDPIRVTDDVVTALDDLAPFIAEAAFG